MNLINGTCWVAYGFAIKDYFILSPNAAGVFLSLVQITLILVFRENTGAMSDMRAMSTRSYFFPSKSHLQEDFGGPARRNHHGANGNSREGVGHGMMEEEDASVTDSLARSNSQQRLVPTP